MKELFVVTEREKDDYKKIIVEGTLEEIKSRYYKQMVKVDHIVELVEVTKKELANLISIHEKFKFPYGILIDDNYILSEELTLYSIIDYENKEIDMANLNKYFNARNLKNRISIDNISVFNVESMFFSEEDDVLLEPYNGFHICNRTDRKELNSAITNAATKLLNMTYPSGKFIYCINALTGEKYLTYNILRHAGSIWSLINAQEYINDPEIEKKIDKLIDYLINNYVVKKGKKAFLAKSAKKDGFSVGANALILLSLADYQLQFNNDKYLDIAIQLADGILSMQQPNGRYFQIYDNNLELVNQFECEYYDGETTLALIKIYSLTKEKKYLDSVIEAIDYYIKSGYEKYSDHWITYTLAELSKYVQDERIIDFAAKNVSAVQRTRFNPTRLESNVQLYKFYQNMKQYKQFTNIIEEFPIEQIEDNINFYLKSLMSYYIGNELSIYMKDKEKSQYGFFCPSDNNRMRIDDIQHSLMGLINYCKYCNIESSENV